MEDKIYLFTTTRCPKCPEAKEYVKTAGLEDKVTIIEADTSVDAMTLASSYNITHVPAFVIHREEDEEGEVLNLTAFKAKQRK